MIYFVLLVEGKEKGLFRSEYEAIKAAEQCGYKKYLVERIDTGGKKNGRQVNGSN